MLRIVHIQPSGCQVFAGTTEHARALLSARLARTDLPAAPGWETLQLRRNLRESPAGRTPYVVPETEIVRALRDVSTPGIRSSVALANLVEYDRRPGQSIVVSDTWKQEYALWLFRRFAGAGPKEWTAELLNQWHPEGQLSFLGGLKQRAGTRPVRYVSEVEADRVRTLDKLLSAPANSQGATQDELLPFLRYLNQASPPQEAYLLGSDA